MKSIFFVIVRSLAFMCFRVSFFICPVFSARSSYLFRRFVMNPLEAYSKEYFSELNSIASKLSADMENVKRAYKPLWHTLSKSEQNQVLDENIIDPSAILKYSSNKFNLPKNPPYSYSWFTKSQLELYKAACETSQKEWKPLKKAETRDIMGKAKPHKTIISKPKAPPPPPPLKSEEGKGCHNNIIPKTGFDFLDNW